MECRCIWIYSEGRVLEGGIEEGKAFGYFKGKQVGVGPGLLLGFYIR